MVLLPAEALELRQEHVPTVVQLQLCPVECAVLDMYCVCIHS